MADRPGAVTFKGKPLTLVGDTEVKPGQKIPDAKISSTLTDDIQMSSLKGKTVLLNIVPSLDTAVCSTQTIKFNEEAKKLGKDVVVLTISRDLPVAQKRWCEANSVADLQMASDYKHHEFGEKLGLVVKELGLLARSVFVIDNEGVVKYSQLVKEVTEEPDYQAAVDAAKKLKK